MDPLLEKAANIINKARHCLAYTGAGISVESGIPPFRGKDGLWSKYDPAILDLNTYFEKPEEVWPVIRELFYNYFETAKPNLAHQALAKLDKINIIEAVITQNIDNLHQQAGSREVIEFHGNSKTFICTKDASHVHRVQNINFDAPYPQCPDCGSLTKPSFIFFGEQIPTDALIRSQELAAKCDVMIIVGSTGEVFPAAQIPWVAKNNGATIIEVNTASSSFTYNITDILLKGKAGNVLSNLTELIAPGIS